jgi:alkylation response protein AidB-like acyl-CoA dehydrogenase
MDIGRRHFPLNCAFQNGPIHGKDVFLPLSQMIGGEDYIGHGWRMLVECLSIGRSITLPSTSSGASRLAAVVSGAYARIRKQFGLSIGRFEGVEEALARIAGNTYAMTALSQADRGGGRPRREAGRAQRDREIPLHRDGARSGEGRHGHPRRQGRDPRARATTLAAAGRRRRSRSRSRAPTS